MKRLVIFMSVLALTIGTAATAEAAQPTKRYTSCKALWKKYPNGIVMSSYFADRAVKMGYKPPRVALMDYFANDRFEVDYVVCAVAPADVIPNSPTITSTYPNTNGQSILAFWNAPANAGMKVVYDVYLNGTKVNEGVTKTLYEWGGLAAGTTYIFGVLARNPAGSSALATVSATTKNPGGSSGTGTPTQAPAPTTPTRAPAPVTPSQVQVTYSATGTVDVTIQTPTGTQQFGHVTNPSYQFSFAPGAFVYISAQNQNDSGNVSCTVTSNGRTVSSNTSSGAYVIASCSGVA